MKKVLMVGLALLVSVAFVTAVFAQAPAKPAEKPAAAPEKAPAPAPKAPAPEKKAPGDCPCAVAPGGPRRRRWRTTGELRAAESRIAAAGFRITQAVSRENKPQSVATGETGLGIADKAANLERCKSSYHTSCPNRTVSISGARGGNETVRCSDVKAMAAQPRKKYWLL